MKSRSSPSGIALFQNLKILPILFPSKIPAAINVTARKHIAQTPNALAELGPEPSICDNSNSALVMGKNSLFCANINESDTSSMEKLNANNPPTSKLATISGNVILHNTCHAVAPKLRAAFSSSSGVCSKPETTERTT